MAERFPDSAIFSPLADFDSLTPSHRINLITHEQVCERVLFGPWFCWTCSLSNADISVASDCGMDVRATIVIGTVRAISTLAA